MIAELTSFATTNATYFILILEIQASFYIEEDTRKASTPGTKIGPYWELPAKIRWHKKERRGVRWLLKSAGRSDLRGREDRNYLMQGRSQIRYDGV